MGYNISIDGPSGAGKSTLSKEVSKRLGFVYIDTGAIYRTIGLYSYRNGISPDNTNDVIASLDKINVNIKFINGEQHVFLNDEDVSKDIRLHIISEYTSKISAIPRVREFLLEMQRKLASVNNVIMDGRDIGTVVLPNADVKIYLTASAEVRAKRRFDELIEKGESVRYDDILSDVISRDERDMNRETSPLKIPENAIVVDTSEFSFAQSVDVLLSIIKERIK